MEHEEDKRSLENVDWRNLAKELASRVRYWTDGDLDEADRIDETWEFYGVLTALVKRFEYELSECAHQRNHEGMADLVDDLKEVLEE